MSKEFSHVCGKFGTQKTSFSHVLKYHPNKFTRNRIALKSFFSKTVGSYQVLLSCYIELSKVSHSDKLPFNKVCKGEKR